jgi:hypothetical protein
MLRKIARKAGLGKALLRMRQKRNEARLQALTDKHKGDDAVIVGMGPSLRIEDLELFGKMRSFACNKIYLAFDQVKWRPTYYSVIDILVAQNNQRAIMAADFGRSLGIHPGLTWGVMRQQPRAVCYNYSGSIASWSPGEPAAMHGCLREGLLGYGYTVVVDQIQMAYAMGFKRVYLVGVDFSFAVGKKSGESCASGKILLAGSERNHFHSEYRKPGETWTVPRMSEMQHAYEFCRAAFEADGRLLLNASRRSELTSLERVPFDDVFG